MLVLSLFPGIGLLDRAFEAEDFAVVRGPDLIWGGNVRDFHKTQPEQAVLAGGGRTLAAGGDRRIGAEEETADRAERWATRNNRGSAQSSRSARGLPRRLPADEGRESPRDWERRSVRDGDGDRARSEERNRLGPVFPVQDEHFSRTLRMQRCGLLRR